jgi:hypothetical protein
VVSLIVTVLVQGVNLTVHALGEEDYGLSNVHGSSLLRLCYLVQPPAPTVGLHIRRTSRSLFLLPPGGRERGRPGHGGVTELGSDSSRLYHCTAAVTIIRSLGEFSQQRKA